MRRFLIPVLLVLLVVPGCGGGDQCGDFNLVLISIDTLRADFLGSYGYPERVTPNLDRLAARSLFCTNAFATAPFTGPSHASILTSQHPSTHGVIYNGHRARNLAIGAQSITLAEHLRARGFNTKAVVSGGPLDARFGFGRGFESYNLVPQMGYPDSGGDPAQVNRRAGNWLLDWKFTGQEERFFLWVHYFTPHLPYLNRPSVRKTLGITFDETIDEAGAGTHEQEDVRQAYRAEAFAVDTHIGEFLARLDELELADNTVVAVVADHGEYLQEHGLTNHHDLYREVLHVPLFIHWETLKEARRLNGTVSTIDLAPTLLALLGVEALPTAQGRNLLQQAADDEGGLAFAEWRDFHLLGGGDPRPGDFLVSVRRGQKKLIRDVLFPDHSRCFDLAADPQERDNRYGAGAPFQSGLTGLLDAHIRNDLPRGLAGIDSISLDRESLEMLRSLGYVR